MKKNKVNIQKLNYYCRIGNPNDLEPKEKFLYVLSKNGNKLLKEKYRINKEFVFYKNPGGYIADISRRR